MTPRNIEPGLSRPWREVLSRVRFRPTAPACNAEPTMLRSRLESCFAMLNHRCAFDARDPEFVYRPACSSAAPKAHCTFSVFAKTDCVCANPQVSSSRSATEGDINANHANFRVQYLVQDPFSGGGIAAQISAKSCSSGYPFKTWLVMP